MLSSTRVEAEGGAGSAGPVKGLEPEEAADPDGLAMAQRGGSSGWEVGSRDS